MSRPRVADPSRLVTSEEGVRVELRVSDQARPRPDGRGAEDAALGISKDKGSKPEASLQTAQHLVERYAVPQLLDEPAQDGQLFAGPIRDR